MPSYRVEVAGPSPPDSFSLPRNISINVRLYGSTCPSDCGCEGDDLVFSMSKSYHTSAMTLDSKLVM